MRRTGRGVISVAVLGTVLFGVIGPARADLKIADGGRSDYVIVLAPDALTSERYAAEELQAYLAKISGVKLPIRRAEEVEAGQKTVVLAGTAAASSELGTDGYRLHTRGGSLVIAGGRPRGVLNGVYGLLEDHLGVRWFAPDCELVPNRSTLTIPDLDDRQVPALVQREVYWTEFIRNPDFAARHRTNGNSYGLAEKHGGRSVVYHPFVHSLDALVPPGLFKEHPEYFPLIKGERKNGYVQRCLTNPDVVRMSIEKVRRWIKEHPEANVISVSQNDTFNNCECPACKAIDDAEGTPMGSFLTYVNAVAAAVAQESPNVRIDTLAYQYTRRPPAKLRPLPNVDIRLCSIECCFAHPLDSCPAPENQKFKADIEAWQPVAPRLTIWDYTTNFANYQQPFPNFDALQANVKFFVSHNVRGLFEQGNYSPGGHGEMEPLRAYVLAKLLWNPDADVKRHTAEFLSGYYGPASDAMGRYVELMQAQVRTGDRHAHIFEPPTASYLNDAFLTQAEGLFEEAEKATSGAERERVEQARLPVWYVKLAAGKVAGEERKALLARFLDVARRAGISHIRESQALEDWAQKMEAAR